MNVYVRSRPAPDPMWPYYKQQTFRMRDDETYRSKMRDKVAYIYITGQFPSHLRKESRQVLQTMITHAPSGTALDRRGGMVKVADEVVADLDLNAHPLVQKVRQKLRQGYFIQKSRGHGTRRNYGKIFMFKLNADGIQVGQITVNGDTSVKEGW